MLLSSRRAVIVLILFSLVSTLSAQEAHRRWEIMNEIRRDKFDLVLPEVMRENKIDMWITVMKEGLWDPLHRDFGGGYVGGIGYYVFTDRGGDRIERAALGINGGLLEGGNTYDIFASSDSLAEFVRERDPKSIGLNMSSSIGAADGLSHTSFLHLSEVLGEEYASRFVSAERLASDFRSRRVASEIAAFSEAAETARQLAERVFSREVITPGQTTLGQAAWWLLEQLHDRNLDTSFGMPSVYITGPSGIEAVSDDTIIQPGDLLMLDWGVGLMNFYTDSKRVAYVLKPGESAVPAGIQKAFDNALEVRKILRRTIRPGRTAQETYEAIGKAVEAAGYSMMKEFNKPAADDTVEVIVGCHSVGNLGHGIGPSIAWFNPLRMQFEIKPSNLFSIELFVYTPAPEFGGKKVRIPLEDDAMATTRGVEWLAPANHKLLVIP